MQATFRRYGPRDPLCCPSSIATVGYRIDRGADGPVLTPTRITRGSEGVSRLNEATLKNASYELPDLGGIRLRDGRYERVFGEGATQVTRVTYVLGGTGHLDGTASKMGWRSSR